MTNLHHKIAELEALLFIHGEPLTIKKIQGILELEEKETEELVNQFKESLAGAERGVQLIVHSGKVQLATKPQFSKIIESFVKEQVSEELSPASLETLAIISYFGPISRTRIDYQRGVNSAFILRNLLLRGLVDRAADPDQPGSYVYSPSFELMRHLGITSRQELPEFEKFGTLLHKFEAQLKGEETEEKTS